MKKNRVWLFAIVFGIMLITTVCYITTVRNVRTEYANGRIVERTVDEPDIGMVAFNWTHEKLNLSE